VYRRCCRQVEGDVVTDMCERAQRYLVARAAGVAGWQDAGAAARDASLLATAFAALVHDCALARVPAHALAACHDRAIQDAFSCVTDAVRDGGGKPRAGAPAQGGPLRWPADVAAAVGEWGPGTHAPLAPLTLLVRGVVAGVHLRVASTSVGGGGDGGGGAGGGAGGGSSSGDAPGAVATVTACRDTLRALAHLCLHAVVCAPGWVGALGELAREAVAAWAWLEDRLGDIDSCDAAGLYLVSVSV